MKKLFSIALIVLLFSIQSLAGIRVMSYNVRYGKANDGNNSWNIRKVATPAMLSDVKPDVFGVQEALDFQIKYICDNCPQYKSIGVGRDDGVEKGEHMSIFYNTDKIELLDWGTYWLSETPEVPSKGWDAACYRTATWALMKDTKSGKKFFFVNTHLDHRGFVARKEGLALLYRKISEMNPESLPMVLTGDFNILPDNEGLVDIDKLMKSARFNARKADPNGSFNGWGKYASAKDAPTLDKEPKKALTPIDYIYYAGFRKCKTFKVVLKQYEGIPYISDHFPIYADLVF